MTDLRQAAQAVIDRWDSPLWKAGSTADAIADLRTALEQQAEPVAVYGYCPDCGAKGVTRERRANGDDKCTNGHTYPSSTATPVQPLLMNHNGAVRKVHGYPPQQQAEPVAWMDREGDLYKMPEIENWAPPHTMLYPTPPQRKPLTDEMRKQMKEASDSIEMRGAFANGWLSAEAAHGIKEGT